MKKRRRKYVISLHCQIFYPGKRKSKRVFTPPFICQVRKSVSGSSHYCSAQKIIIDHANNMNYFCHSAPLRDKAVDCIRYRFPLKSVD